MEREESTQATPRPPPLQKGLLPSRVSLQNNCKSGWRGQPSCCVSQISLREGRKDWQVHRIWIIPRRLPSSLHATPLRMQKTIQKTPRRSGRVCVCVHGIVICKRKEGVGGNLSLAHTITTRQRKAPINCKQNRHSEKEGGGNIFLPKYFAYACTRTQKHTERERQHLAILQKAMQIYKRGLCGSPPQKNSCHARTCKTHRRAKFFRTNLHPRRWRRVCMCMRV